MQTTKEYTHKLLLETARKAFFKKGFKAVSRPDMMKEVVQHNELSEEEIEYLSVSIFALVQEAGKSS